VVHLIHNAHSAPKDIMGFAYEMQKLQS